MWNGYVSSLCCSFIICYFLSLSMCVRVCVCALLRHSSSRNLRRCDLRDTVFRSFWGLRGAEVSEFQFPPNSHSQSHTLTPGISLSLSVSLSHTQHQTHSTEFILIHPPAFFFLSLSAINTASHFLPAPFIRSHKKKCSLSHHCTVQSVSHPPSHPQPHPRLLTPSSN